MRVTVHEDGNLALSLPDGHYLHEMAKALQKRRWLPARRLWVFPPILGIMDSVKQYMPGVTWEASAEAKYASVKKTAEYRDRISNGQYSLDLSSLDNVPFKLPPREAQKKALLLGRDQESFAYLMDQGTGKTKVILDDAAHNFRCGRIDCLLVLAPNSVKTNWVNPEEDVNDQDTWDEVTKHMAPDIPVIKAAWFASPSPKAKREMAEFEEAIRLKTSRLLVFAINVDGLNTPKALQFLEKLLKARRVMIAVDESTRIANHASKRHKVARAIRKQCRIARIASGTPVIKSPLKAYGQFGFLDPNIIGIATYTEFKARYSIANPHNPNHVVKFINTEELAAKIAGCSFRVLKSECLDLDPKTHSRRNVHLTAEQRRLYDDMREEFIVEFQAREQNARMNGETFRVTATNVMTQMARLQQIVSGYLPIIDEDTNEQIGVQKIGGSTPPKVEEAIEIIENCDHKVIVWCRYRFEVQEMAAALKKEGVNHVTFFGDTKETARISARQQFLSDPALKVFVGQIQTGGVGLNLYSANTVIYLSNTFSTEDRLQSEDRAHRHGNVGGVEYIDLIAPKTVDERVIKVLRDNKLLSDQIMRDGYIKWL
jgi:SNF2 family DNA or RNA helicase